MISTYNYSLVVLSVFIGMSAAYAALDLAGRVTSSRGRVRSAWFAGGAIAMGVGIWSMHFIGMQAFGLPVPVKYDWPTVLVSLLAGLIAAACSLLVVGREKMGSFRIVGGGVIMGAAIVTVHYSGMHAMRTTADCRYDLRLVFLSVVLAVLTSIVGLWLGFHFRDETAGTFRQRIAGAIVAGASISLMHYTGMAAATFVPSSAVPALSHAISISTLGAAAIAIVTVVIQGIAILTSYVDRRFAAQKAELLSSQLLQMQDEERRRIARDLHDDLGQALYAAGLNLGQISNLVVEVKALKLLSETRDMIRVCLEKVRTIAHLLHPPELERLGLKSAIVVYVDGFRERSGIQVDIDIPAQLPHLSRPVEVALLRMTQECLLNIQRHSKSSKAQIRLGAGSNQLTLEVRDEGTGMRPAVSETTCGDQPKLGVGLAGLAQRIEQLGGRLEICSGSWGTSVKAILPLSSSEARLGV